MQQLTSRHFSHLGTSGLDGMRTLFTSSASIFLRNDSTLSSEVLREYRNAFAQRSRTSCTKSSAVAYLEKGGGESSQAVGRNAGDGQKYIMVYRNIYVSYLRYISSAFLCKIKRGKQELGLCWRVSALQAHLKQEVREE